MAADPCKLPPLELEDEFLSRPVLRAVAEIPSTGLNFAISRCEDVGSCSLSSEGTAEERTRSQARGPAAKAWAGPVQPDLVPGKRVIEPGPTALGRTVVPAVRGRQLSRLCYLRGRLRPIGL